MNDIDDPQATARQLRAYLSQATDRPATTSWAVLLMLQTYRVRFAPEAPGRVKSEDVQTTDVQCELDQLPAQLPADIYVLYVEDMNLNRAVHWTRWPSAYRPGARNETTGRVVK